MTDMANDGHVTSDEERGDLELEEGWRAAAAAGFDNDMTIEDMTIEDMTIENGVVRCAACGRTSAVTELTFVGALFVRDTPTGRDDLAVHELHCPHCGRASRLAADAALMADVADATGAPGESNESVVESPGEVDAHHPTDRTAARPLGDDKQFFDEGGPGNLRDRETLVDADGDDVRMYTGEPVETEEGWVLPRQQNVGPGNMAGHGEFPDPNTPPAQERPAS